MLAEGWEQADTFVAAVKSELALRPLPAPYYPGLRQRYQALKEAYPQVRGAEHELDAEKDTPCQSQPAASSVVGGPGTMPANRMSIPLPSV